MKKEHLRERKRRAFRMGLCKQGWIASLVVLVSWFATGASAQTDTYYEYDNYDPAQLYKSGVHGTLFNSQPKLLTGVQTTLNGLQDVWTTAYLPYAVQEYDANFPLGLFGTHYTTGIALASSSNPSVGLYAPVQVRAVTNSYNEPGKLIKSAFAKDLPIGLDPSNIQGPFNALLHLNEDAQSFASAETGQRGISILANAQQFTRFGHEELTDINGVGWNGYDKKGKRTIKFIVAQGTIPGSPKAHFRGDEFGDGEIVITETLDYYPVSRITVGHEIAHAIILDIHGWQTFENFSIARHEINEGFADIIGHSFRLWSRPEQFTIMDWERYRESVLPAEKKDYFNNPKSTNWPSTYLGEFYQTDLASPKYKVHANGHLLSYWFTLIVDGKNGYIDDKVERGPFSVKPLIPGDTQASYRLALRILFNTFVNKLTANTDYPSLRDAVAQTATEFGYGPGTHVYNQLEKAWIAIGVVSPNYHTFCTDVSSESLVNGTLDFNALKTYLGPSILSPKVTTLVDCSDADTISTVTSTYYPFTDLDDNNTYSNEEGSDEKSKMAVSIHAFSQLAKRWFKQRFGYAGYKATNVLQETATVTQIVEKGNVNSATFFYPNQDLSACRDKISLNYFEAFKAFNGVPNDANLPYSGDQKTIETWLGQTFSLEIKKDYERAKQNPEAEKIWTIFEEMSNPSLLRNFANPKLNGQPALYKGINWSADQPEHNTGFLNLFYYLLVHGTEDDNGQDVGYTNDELPNKVYFVNKVDKDLVLRVLWDAYRAVSVNASIEEFRQATLTALHSNPQYHPKSKEHIAFHDAWAAVLGIPDYASTLAHSPDDDAVVYPWPVKVGVESEYPMYESYRLFEVSKSATFSENEAPVYRFVSNQAPDLVTSMTYGLINLEPKEKYFVRSHLADGPEAREHCAGTDDPHFCESLLKKKKWTLTYPLTTEAVPAPVTISPAKGQVISAWASPISFGSVKGALGYDIHVTDLLGTVAEHNIPVDIAFDEDQPDKPVKTFLALSKDKPYSYNVAARQRLGSEWAVHVLPGGMLTLLTEDEKAQFPNTYGEWNEVMDFKTDIPSIKLHSPANGAHVPIFGVDTTVRAKKEFPQLADYYQYSFREPFYTDKALELDSSFAHYPISIQGLIGLEDKKAYEWTFIQRKKVTPPFIMEEEEGASPGWFTFIVDKDLVPAPVLKDIDCVQDGSQVKVFWDEVPGAQSYKLTVINASTQAVVKSGQTGYPSATINGASTFPNTYIYKVAAGVKGANGDWIFGKEAEGSYTVFPPPASNLSPDNVSGVKLGDGNSVTLSWDLPAGVQGARLFAKVDGTSNELADEFVAGNSFTLTDLDFNQTIFWSVTSQGTDKSCQTKEVAAAFTTESEPIIPELNFNFSLLCFDSFGLPGPVADYNLVIRDPNGDVVFNQMGLKSHFSNPKGILPITNGIYKVDAIITKADPVYLKTPEMEGAVSLQTQLWDIGAANQELDSDTQGGFFEPVTNQQFQFLFEVDLTDNTLHHRSNAGQVTKKALRVYGFEVKYPEIEMTIFPNPASSKVQVMPGTHHDGQAFALQVLDQQGRTVINRDWRGEELDVSMLAEGIYIVKVQRGNLLFTQKLAITK